MLTEVLMTRCCHDLAGATGAFANTLQLMEMDASFTTEGVDFLKKSAAMLTARLQFFRALAGLNGKVTSDIANAYLKTLSIPPVLKGAPQTQVDLAFVLIGSETLIKGGTIDIRVGEVVLTGERLLFPDTKRALLNKNSEPAADDYTPANAAYLWVRHLLNGKSVTVLAKGNSLLFQW